ncbi:hypothetical protein I3843_11G188400 [Carya illinoinensis]|uniref:GDPGP1-like C-terminal domain-containing protein n=1 Tax=Carya illinoinensis TaxID=32201 RepID=A0A922DSY7_CARIL|nr:hypothetical protein I3842_11G190400 [Carya illinoinensis]KAG7957699.1 hypothetical protein I3843_11G188400 [Carya illinoinensis]
MLRIKRVPTVVSNYQKEEAEDVARRGGGCGRNCLNKCCIQGAKLPLYAFKKLNKIASDKGLAGHESGKPPVAFLDSLLLGEWEDRMQRGLFRYDVTACETKVIPGNYGFIAQLNEGRHLKKRPTEFRVDKVLQPFDGNKFNFTKVGQEEVLFQLEASDDGEVQFFPNAPVDVENSPSVLLNYPVRGLVFEGGYTVEDLSNTVSDACICLQANNIPYNVLIADCGRRVFLLPQCYAEKQALGEVSAELLDTQVNPAVWEISGHMVLKRKKDYEEASEENAWRLLAEVSLSEARFEEVYALIFEAIVCVDNGKGDASESSLEEPDVNPQPLEEVDAINNNSRHNMVTGTQECIVMH